MSSVYKYTVVKIDSPLVHGVAAINTEADPGNASMRTGCGQYYLCPADSVRDGYRMVTCIECIVGDLTLKLVKDMNVDSFHDEDPTTRNSTPKLKVVV
jgi:hypothetical protein